MSIWRFQELASEFDTKDVLYTIGEGDTVCQEIKYKGLNIFLKREDFNPTGSWKDRSTAYKISKLAKNGMASAVIASSGNAAISYMTFANLVPDFNMHIVVSPHISTDKRLILENLAGEKHKIYFESQAKSFSTKLALQLKSVLLKSSVDDEMVRGYQSLGFEVYEEHKKRFNEQSILISAASSGAGVLGLVDGLFYKMEDETRMPRVFVAQTEACAPLVGESEGASSNPTHPLLSEERNESSKEFSKEDSIFGSTQIQKSLAEAIVDKSMLRQYKVRLVMANTNGQAFAISNDELERAKGFVKEIDPKNSRRLQDLSYTSLLSFASFLRIKENKLAPEIKNYFLIATGR
jgi:threonine synthase